MKLSHQVIEVHGVDATSFLQGQLTIDVESMDDNQAQLGCHLNPKGRIVSLFHCLRVNNEKYLLILNKNQATLAETALKKYAIFSKVVIKSLDWDVYGGVGTDIPGSAAHACQAWGQPQLLYWLSESDIELDSDLIMTNETVWHAISLYHNTPYLTEKTTETIIPLSLRLDEVGAVDFKKGCYTGQEFVARMHYRNKRGKELQLTSVLSDSMIDKVCVDGDDLGLE